LVTRQDIFYSERGGMAYRGITDYSDVACTVAVVGPRWSTRNTAQADQNARVSDSLRSLWDYRA